MHHLQPLVRAIELTEDQILKNEKSEAIDPTTLPNSGPAVTLFIGGYAVSGGVIGP